jgi:hypothetical protein
MKIQPTINTGDMSGKSGGGVMLKGNLGRIARTPKNPQSSDQNKVRNTFKSASQAWGGLTEAQRTSWNAAGQSFMAKQVFGNGKALSGKSLYNRIYCNIVAAGGSAPTDVPATFSVTALTNFVSLVNSSSAQTHTFAPTPVPANHVLVISATPPQSAGTSSLIPSKLRVIKRLAAATATGASTFTEYVAKFGTPIVGKKIFFRAYLLNLQTGTKSGVAGYTSTTA